MGDGGAGGAEPRPYGVEGSTEGERAALRVVAPYGVCISAGEIRRAIRESPLRVLSKQEGVIKGETRCCPLEIASARSADKHVSAETCAIVNPTTACVGTLRKHAGGMFLVPTTAAMPRGGNREGRGRDSSLRSE